MQRTKWLERKFNFDFPAGMIYAVLERLRGTLPRIQAMTSALTEQQLTYKAGNSWSIKEHIGHLSDLEDLHEGRIDDFLSGKDTLRAADMTNAKTNAADHNSKSIQELLSLYTPKRQQFISRLQQLDDDIQNSRSLHPRLQVLMRPVDMAYFTAEHDDHHLTSIRETIVALQ